MEQAIKMKKTPLYEEHLRAGGRMVDFHGWLLPVQYGGIIEEHQAVRSSAGLFDVSHMGELEVKGPDAEEFLQSIVTNDIEGIDNGQMIYSPMCYRNGGTVDDLIIYRFARDHFLLVVNASNTQKDYEWLLENLKGNAALQNLSDAYAQLALQGPKAQMILQKLAGCDLNIIKFFHFANNIKLGGVEAILSRSGYTGEDGFEIYVSPADAGKLWGLILDAGGTDVRPAGLGARDTLRFEAALPLYGQELSEDISPVEAGLAKFVEPDKKDFNGKPELVRQLAEGTSKRIAGFEMLDRGMPRSHYEVFAGGRRIGFVTSGGFCPSLKSNLGMALIETDYSRPGSSIEIAIREKALMAKTIKMPFYKKQYKNRGF